MKQRIAFAGFRHDHIYDLYRLAMERNGLSVSAAAEEDPDRAEDARRKGVTLTHPDIASLLDDTKCYDFLAIGDVYGSRGSLAIRALDLGKHIILDKPVCTRLKELEKIKELSRRKNLAVGCMLTLRNTAPMRTLRRLIAENTIGRVQTVTFLGQHPLLYGRRPMWYFEPEPHGGTINDIAIHACDTLPWMLKTPVSEVTAARVWNAGFPKHPEFQLCGQLMLRMKDGTGILGDVSYLSPNSLGYAVPQYWRFTVSGTRGILETSITASEVLIWRDGESRAVRVKLDSERRGGYLDDFLGEVTGDTAGIDSTTEQVLAAAHTALTAQKSADESLSHVKLPELSS